MSVLSIPATATATANTATTSDSLESNNEKTDFKTMKAVRKAMKKLKWISKIEDEVCMNDVFEAKADRIPPSVFNSILDELRKKGYHCVLERQDCSDKSDYPFNVYVDDVPWLYVTDP